MVARARRSRSRQRNYAVRLQVRNEEPGLALLRTPQVLFVYSAAVINVGLKPVSSITGARPSTRHRTLSLMGALTFLRRMNATSSSNFAGTNTRRRSIGSSIAPSVNYAGGRDVRRR
jgi:hypothetical protein